MSTETDKHSLTACPPWLMSDGVALMNRSKDGRLPHAILLSGIAGIGKRAFSQWLAESLLCRNRGDTGACGRCDSCRQLQSGAHPDFRRLLPEGANAAIKVDPIRALVEWMQLTASQGSYRIAVLEQADTMNRNAANSLLKTLEEPSDHAVIILSATRTGALPATIRSRCQTIHLKMHDRPAALVWLAQSIHDPESALLEAGGGPYAAIARQDPDYLAARELLLKAWRDLFLHKGSVGRISDSLADLDTSLCLALFSRWTLLAAKQRANLSLAADPVVEQVISETRDCLSLEQWFTLHERLLQLHRTDSASFKTQAVLEGMFADTRIMTNG